MRDARSTSLVVGAGPAGSVAATVLARGGARVALVDKAGFPRDKACGDLVGPRGVQLLRDLGLPLRRPAAGRGHGRGRARPAGGSGCPAPPACTYPGHGLRGHPQPRSTPRCTRPRSTPAPCRSSAGRTSRSWADDDLDGFACRATARRSAPTS